MTTEEIQAGRLVRASVIRILNEAKFRFGTSSVEWFEDKRWIESRFVVRWCPDAKQWILGQLWEFQHNF